MSERDYDEFASKLENVNYHTQVLMIQAMKLEKFELLKPLADIQIKHLLIGHMPFDLQEERREIAKKLK